MKDQFVTYEIAKYLKDLGFDEPCLGIYNGMQEIYCDSKIEHFTSQEKVQYIFGNDKVNVILAPLWQQVIDWFREKYNIFIDIQHQNGFFWYVIDSYNFPEVIKYTSDDVVCNNFYDIREQSILKSIEIIKK